MSNPNKISVRFHPDQLIADDIQFPPKTRLLIEKLAQNNIEKESTTVKKICANMLGLDEKFTINLRKAILKYAIKHQFENKSEAIKHLCKSYFEKHSHLNKI